MEDNIRDLVDMWLWVLVFGTAMFTYGAAGFIFYEPRR